MLLFILEIFFCEINFTNFCEKLISRKKILRVPSLQHYIVYPMLTLVEVVACLLARFGVVFSSVLVDTTSTSSFCSIMNGLNWPNEVNEGWLKGFYRFLSIIGSLCMAQLLSLADHDLSRLEKDKYQNKQKMPAFMRD